MSWSDDTRCLYCDGKLPLYRKLTNGQFCSTPHQKAYWKEQERLAVEVLHRTHDALMAYRPQGDIELIIGPSVGSPPPPAAPLQARPDEPVRARVERPAEPFAEPAAPPAYAIPQDRGAGPEPPPFANFLPGDSPEDWTPRWTTLPLMLKEEPAPFELVLEAPLHPLETLELAAINQTLAAANAVPVPFDAAVVGWASPEVAPLLIRPSAPALVASLLEPFSPELDTVAPPSEPIAPDFSDHMASLPRPVFLDILGGGVPVVAQGALEFALPAVILEPAMVAGWPAPHREPALCEFEPPVMEEAESEGFHEVEHAGPIPAVAGWCHRPAGFASISCTALQVERGLQPLELPLQSPSTPALGVPGAVHSGLGLGSLQPLALQAVELDPHPRPAILTWFRLGAFNPAQLIPSSLIAIEPRMRLAGGCRYTTNRVSQDLLARQVEPVSLGVVGRRVAYPVMTGQDRQAALHTNFTPELASLADLTAWKSETPARELKRSSARSRGAGQILAFPEAIWIPDLRLQPRQWAPFQPAMEEPKEDIAPPAPFVGLPAPAKVHPHLGELLLGFWKNAPRDLRLLMFAIPALLALAFHPSLPKVHVSTVQATEPVEKNVGQAINGSWTQFKQVVSERAAVALDEDFRSGLDDWASPDGNATEWSFDANGFVRPGSLALYSPSLSLADYQAQFLGLIDQKSLSWVVRAADFSNYYVVKLVVRKPGPLTTLGLTRYAVINGKPQDRVDAVVPFTARPDMLYRVRMDVHDDSFVLAIQGQMVDAWSESRLKKGGIGFFSARGEGSRVRWVQVTHQYDMLGRLCSYLAPYESASVLPTETTTKVNSTKNNGSWQQ